MAIDLLTYEFLKRYVEGSQMGQYAKPRGNWVKKDSEENDISLQIEYSTGDYVTYNNAVYIVPFAEDATPDNLKTQTVSGTIPGANETKWQKIAKVNIGEGGISEEDFIELLHSNLNIENGQTSNSLNQKLDINDMRFKRIESKRDNFIWNKLSPDGSGSDDAIYFKNGTKPLAVDEENGGTAKYAVSLNGKSRAAGNRSLATGSNTLARGENSFTTGNFNIAYGESSVAEGTNTSALGNASHAEGMGTTAGDYSLDIESIHYPHAGHAEGVESHAKGYGAHAEGGRTVASGQFSHASGVETQASGSVQTVIGRANIPDTTKAFIIGNGNTVKENIDQLPDYTGNKITRSNAMTVDWDGNIWAKGSLKLDGPIISPTINEIKITSLKNDAALNSVAQTTSTASGRNSAAFGSLSTAAGENSFSSGYASTAYGQGAHAEGVETTAGELAHIDKVHASHSEGYKTQAKGYGAHAEGGKTEAKGSYSHAGGYETIANSDYQTVIGKANSTTGIDNKLFIIGNGDLNPDYSIKERKNAMTVDQNGNIELAGGIILTDTVTSEKYKLTIADGKLAINEYKV